MVLKNYENIPQESSLKISSGHVFPPTNTTECLRYPPCSYVEWVELFHKKLSSVFSYFDKSNPTITMLSLENVI
jgi:hypothetical protein